MGQYFGELLDGDHCMYPRLAPTPVSRGERHAEQAQLGKLRYQVVGEFGVLIDLLGQLL